MERLLPSSATPSTSARTRFRSGSSWEDWSSGSHRTIHLELHRSPQPPLSPRFFLAEPGSTLPGGPRLREAAGFRNAGHDRDADLVECILNLRVELRERPDVVSPSRRVGNNGLTQPLATRLVGLVSQKPLWEISAFRAFNSLPGVAPRTCRVSFPMAAENSPSKHESRSG